ncbi:MSMEG_0570 family nitrogen starvation response protein [Burkholderia plantarii]|uniref:MSMEG_0570 family nitrogen starvation response protein n=1 Tax=Burkholderia plantarii TaxID=41899 RepID=UPI0018DD99FE|nr:MSMEG_0570 family nitrogen starvation response protein [Burkholderia plantarii]MBI0330613.1 MSMEG_0570 family nitrogen starvation response protein [Burkholderia plantarii]
MPVMHFRVRWPDASETRCYSPSTIVADYFTPGQQYALDDFVARSRESLGIASERVRAKFGYACSAAMDELARIESLAGQFDAVPDAAVTVLALD